MTTSPFLVTTQWLSEHLNDSSVAILDARMSPPGLIPPEDIAAKFVQGHIPGAVYFDIAKIADTTTTLPYMLPSADVFSQAMGELGVNNKQTVVVYDGSALFSAPRVWWTLSTFGVKNVYVLDGGLAQWQQEGHAIETGRVTHIRQTFIATLNQRAIKTTREVLSAIENKTCQILDARSAVRFSGTAEEPRPGLRAGHIPGSINIPYTELLENGKLKSLQALQQLFKSKNVDLNRPIITSCGAGITAAILLLCLRSLNAREVALYDGSFAQWEASDMPIEKSAH